MAAPSKEEYLERYLSSSNSGKRRGRHLLAGRKKRKVKIKGGGMRIMDDDVTWKSLAKEKALEVESDEEDEALVIAEIIDERPVVIQRMEEFRSSNKWKILGDENADSQDSEQFLQIHTGSSILGFDSVTGKRVDSGSQLSKENVGAVSSECSANTRQCHGSSDDSHVWSRCCDSPDRSPPQRGCHNSSDLSAPLSGRHDSPNLSRPQRKKMENIEKLVLCTSVSYEKMKQKDRRARGFPQRLQDSNSDLSPPQKGSQRSSDSDLSPPQRKKLGIRTSDNRPSLENLDMSPAQQRQPTHKHISSKGQVASQDLSPSRKSRGNEMLSGGQAGLVSTDTLRKEKEDRRKWDRAAKNLADDPRYTVTIFRDELGNKRDLDQERLELKKEEKAKAAKLKKYAQWGKGVAQKEQQRQNIEDALYEMQKPLARYIDDEDLDCLLRERERDGDPMARLIRKKKGKEVKNKNEKPRYNGPAPPPNRFNLYPGYRWDGVDRSNGFEKKRFARLAEKKAVQMIAYKWSVEDM